VTPRATGFEFEPRMEKPEEQVKELKEKKL
jgi:hypothetical protein